MAFLTFFGFDPRKTKFRAHRIGGAAFLSVYFVAWAVYTRNYEAFVKYRLIVVTAFIGTLRKKCEP